MKKIKLILGLALCALAFSVTAQPVSVPLDGTVTARQNVALECKVFTQVITNWVTIGYVSPRTTSPGNPVGIKEEGTIATNTIVIVEWKGKRIPVVVETHEAAKKLNRTMTRNSELPP